MNQTLIRIMYISVLILGLWGWIDTQPTPQQLSPHINMAPSFQHIFQQPPQEIRVRDQIRWGVDLRQENADHQVVKELEKEQEVQVALELEQVILQEMAHREWLAHYDQIYQEEFIESFLENAKKAGYLVLLNENLEVVEVRRVKTPQSIRFQ